MNTRQSELGVGPSGGITLGAFLRARRERLLPAQAGIKSQSRRRTPGLRREEVAQLAAISPEWYTYLEQDRDVRPSREVIERIAGALKLSLVERDYLSALAFPKAVNEPSAALPPTLQRFIDDLEYRPAYVVNDLWDLVGWNRSAALLFPGLELSLQPNLVTSVFLNPAWRRIYRDWETNARKMLALFRLTVAAQAGHSRCTALLAELNATSAEFARWWPQQDVAATSAGTKAMIHPSVGELSLDYSSLRTMGDPSLTLIAFSPSNEISKERLQMLWGYGP